MSAPCAHSYERLDHCIVTFPQLYGLHFLCSKSRVCSLYMKSLCSSAIREPYVSAVTVSQVSFIILNFHFLRKCLRKNTTKWFFNENCHLYLLSIAYVYVNCAYNNFKVMKSDSTVVIDEYGPQHDFYNS